ncbi:MAG: AAA family ATPase [Alphaproteobacteria bacterium]|nr:AAA family ATPase [Alphaproteobacteria bacterium]
MNSKIIGQQDLVGKMIITMLAKGHALVEGAPGLAKTKAIKTLAECISAAFNRIQFTPDLLPSDITGSEIYIAQKGEFEFRKGPVFANLVLADEINRAPAKVQSALLEAMAEQQISVGGQRFFLPHPFMVMATQNPIEHEGTYNLPEAQLDRFLMYIRINQPAAEDEHRILDLVRGENNSNYSADSFEKLNTSDIEAASKEALDVYLSKELEEYMVQLIVATRNIEKYDRSLAGLIMYGASPRATIALDRCAKINAWLQGREFVTPADIHSVIFDILRHRVILSFEAQAQGFSSDDIITKILNIVPLP